MYGPYRRGVDVDVAAWSASKRAWISAQRDELQVAADDRGSEAVTTPAPSEPAPRRAALPPLLRPIARAAYLTLKPIVRPIATRWRRFLVAGVLDELTIRRPPPPDLSPTIAAQVSEVAAIRALLTARGSHDLLTTLDRVHTTTAAVLDHSRAANVALAQRLDATAALLDQSRAADVALMQRLDVIGRKLEFVAGSVTAVAGRLDGDAALSNRLEGLEHSVDRVDVHATAAARRIAVPCGDDSILVRTVVGYMMCSAADPFVLAALLDTGDLERGTRLLIERLLQPGNTFVDVGAHLGMHSVAAGRAMRGRGRIVAFEPHPETARLLSDNILLNGFAGIATVHRAAVSDISGTQQLHLGRMSGLHSLYALDADAASASAPLDVSVVTLDATLLDASPTLVKIDAEGAELTVFDGASATIAAHPDVGLIVEFGPSHLRRVGITVDEWFARFTQAGMVYRVIDAMTGAVVDASPAKLAAVESANLLLALPASPVWSRAITGPDG